MAGIGALVFLAAVGTLITVVVIVKRAAFDIAEHHLGLHGLKQAWRSRHEED